MTASPEKRKGVQAGCCAQSGGSHAGAGAGAPELGCVCGQGALYGWLRSASASCPAATPVRGLLPAGCRRGGGAPMSAVCTPSQKAPCPCNRPAAGAGVHVPHLSLHKKAASKRHRPLAAQQAAAYALAGTALHYLRPAPQRTTISQRLKPENYIRGGWQCSEGCRMQRKAEVCRVGGGRHTLHRHPRNG